MREYLESYETEELPAKSEAGRQWHISPLSPVGILAKEAKIKNDTLRSILSGRTEMILFDYADRLFCAMGQPQLWTGPLADLYYSVDLSEVPKFGCGHLKTEENSVQMGRGHGCRKCRNQRKRDKRVAARVPVAA